MVETDGWKREANAEGAEEIDKREMLMVSHVDNILVS